MTEQSDDEDIFEKGKTTKGTPRKRAPRQMTDETRERMALILAKGRDVKLKNSQAKREALEQDKILIKETLKTKLKEVKKQLKAELVEERVTKIKKDKALPAQDDKQAKDKESKEPEKQKPKREEVLKKEPEIVNPEPARKKETAPAVKVVALVQVPAPVQVPALVQVPPPIQVPKPNPTAEYLRKLRAAYHF